MQIVPAILEKEKDVFWQRCEELEKISGLERAQVDFCDGKFVSTETLSIQEIDVLNPTLEWEAHLMVLEPVDFFDYQMSGFGMVIVHLEAFFDIGKDDPLQQSIILEALREIKRLGMKIGLAINPETPVEAVLDYRDLVDQFTILSVHPGLQGQGFLPESIERIKRLRLLLPDAIIEVDGGINENNISSVALAGADLAAIGAALQVDPERKFYKLQALAS